MSDSSLALELAQCPDDAEGIQRFNQLVFGTPLHQGQLNAALNLRKQTNLLSPGNSWGKTEFILREAVRHCWLKLVHGVPPYGSLREWLEKDYRALIASYQFDVAKESFQRLSYRYNAGGPLAQLVTRAVNLNPPKIEFVNGAVLDFGSLDQAGRHVEATRRQAIWVDEVGHIPDFRDIYRGILFPRTIGVNGLIWLLGTPKPNTDPWLFEMAVEGTDPDSYYSFYEGSSYENTFWPSTERERIEANPELFNVDGSLTKMGKQVVLGKFILAGGLFFNRVDVLRMFKGEHEFYIPDGPSVTAWDLGGSKRTADATVGVTLDLSTRPWNVCRLEHLPGGTSDWEGKYDYITRCAEEDGAQVVGVDVTGPGQDSIYEELMRRGVPVFPIHFGGVASKKYDMLRNLQSRMEMQGELLPGELDEQIYERTGKPPERFFKGWIRFPDIATHPELEERKKEFDFYRLEDVKLVQDTVMALAMAAKLGSELTLPEPVYGSVF